MKKDTRARDQIQTQKERKSKMYQFFPHDSCLDLFAIKHECSQLKIEHESNG